MKSELTQERLKELLHYDPDTGVFTWKANSYRRKAGSIAGYNNGKGYIQMRIDSKFYYAHRLAWMWVHGEFPKNEIDHINNVKSDNRISNLRSASRTENLRNMSLTKQNSSGVKGVYWFKRTGKWRAVIRTGGGVHLHLGYHDDIELAELIVEEARRKYHGEFANNGKE